MALDVGRYPGDEGAVRRAKLWVCMLWIGCVYESAPEPVAPDPLDGLRQACAALASTECESMQICLLTTFDASYADIASCVDRQTELCLRTRVGRGLETTADDISACAVANDLSSLPEAGDRCRTWLRRTRGRNPPEPCRASGILEDGDACLLAGQCASGACIGTEVCGRCVGQLTSAHPCLSDKDCERNRACGASGCVAYGDDAPAALCSADQPCHPDLACRDGRCMSRLQEGAGCDPVADPDPCALWPTELACHALEGKCAPIGLVDAPGAPCGKLDEGLAICAAGLACQTQDGMSQGKCGSLIEDGGSCGSEGYPWGGPCRAPAVCIEDRCQIPDVATCGPPPLP